MLITLQSVDGVDINLAEVVGTVTDLFDGVREELGIEMYINESRRTGEARHSSCNGRVIPACFCTTDGCPDNITIVKSHSLTDLDVEIFWMEQPFGGLAELPCPCDAVSLPLNATRRCAGSFGSVVKWVEPDQSQCDFSDTTRILCSLPDVSKHVTKRITLVISPFTSD